ncbi:MAG: hypothetical protein QXN23_03025 [Candidatus Caldarchaeum sp.]|uniref:Carboxypeptidase regulatory-like domain-containing protein n=2 Tax=Caldiarchaeum subterraneum TaxID=311458 RepID=A0A7C4I798_CALS0
MGIINRLQPILLTAALLASCFLLLGSLPEAHATTGVTIRVLTIDTNQPLKGAEVRINGTAIGATNATGHVNANTLNRMSNSTVEVFFRDVRVYHHPYFNATRLNPSNPAQVTIRVNVTTMVLLARTALGNPVPNVRITLVYGSYTNTTTTGSDGRSSLAFMPNTTYTISTSYRGYDVGTFTKAYGGSGLTLDLNLFSIRAIVEDLNGNPVPSATVKVWYGVRQSGNTTGFESATTDSDGVAILDKLPAGNYPLDVEYRGENVYQTTSNIALSSGQVVHRARTDLVNYRVRILDFDGTEQITGVSLQAQLYRDATPYGDPVTTATGEFAFGLVKSRTYSLVVKMGDTEVFRGDVRVPDDTSVAGKFFDVFFRVDASGTRSERLVSTVGLRIQLGSFSSERTTVNGATGFQNIPAGRYSYEITRGTYVIGSGTVEINQDEQRITLRPTLWTVKLLINNDQGEGIAGAVELKSYDDVSLGVFQAGENGEVSVSGLLPILYRGVVNYKGVKVNDGFEFTLDADQKEVVVTTKVYNVVFLVFDADGETALSSAQVTVSLGEISAESVTDSNGRASVKNLPIGSYNVAINYLSIGVHEETVRIESSREIVLKAKNVVDVIVEVVDDDGVPLESGDVEIVLGVVKKSGEIENGRVTFKDIPASTYRLSARYKGVTVYDRQTVFRSDEDLVRVQAAVYYLRLTVKKMDDTVLPAAYVSVFQGGRKIGDGFTDQSGRLEIKLPRGDFALEVSYQDTVVLSQSISLAQTTPLALQAKVYRIDVRIIDPSGEPVAGAEVSLNRGEKVIERKVTNEDGIAILYAAEGDYTWTMKIGEYTYSSSYSSRANKSLSILHVVDNPQWQGVVLAATAAVSTSSVFGLLRWGRLRPSGRQRGGQRPQRAPQPRGGSEAQTFKRLRRPRV